MKKIILAIAGNIFLIALVAQNVGINQPNPVKAKFEVNGVAGNGNTMAIFGTDGAGVSFQRNWPTIGFNQYRDDPNTQGKYISNGYAAIQYFNPNSGAFAIDMFPAGTGGQLTPAGTRAITMLNNGNTSIRGASTNAMLTVARGDGAWGTAVFAGPSNWSHINYSADENTYIRPGVNGGTVHVNRLPISTVLIGYSNSRISVNSFATPSHTVEIWAPNGQKAFTLVDNYNNRWAINPGGYNTPNNGFGVHLDYYYNNTGRSRFRFYDGAFISISDSSLKTDIQPLEPVLDKVNQLKPVRYEMVRNNPGHEQSIGLIAQDVQPLFPHLIHQVNDHYKQQPLKDALVMNYSGFGVLAIKALQEQQVQIKALEKELTDLLAEIELLTNAK